MRAPSPHGWWRIDALDRPRRIEFANGLAGEDGEPDPGIEPMPSYVTFEPVDDGTRMTVVAGFVDLAQMERLLDMGMREGLEGAMSQIDDILSGARI